MDTFARALRSTPTCILAFSLLSPAALAGGSMSGSFWDVSYGNPFDLELQFNGISFEFEDPYASSSAYGWNELTYSSQPWQQVSIEYNDTTASYFYEANDAEGTCDFTVESEVHHHRGGDLVDGGRPAGEQVRICPTHGHLPLGGSVNDLRLWTGSNDVVRGVEHRQ